MSRSPLPPETPRVEPEIIPPGRTGRGPDRGHLHWEAVDQHGAHRIYVTRLGPFSIFGFVLLFGVVVAALIALFLGAVLIALPVVALLIAAAVVASFLRPRLRHPR